MAENYIEEAAGHLWQAGQCYSSAEAIERQPRPKLSARVGLQERASLNNRAAEHERMAAAYTRLAAIERGLPPCNCHEPRQDPEE
jgi:hypothetical protein